MWYRIVVLLILIIIIQIIAENQILLMNKTMPSSKIPHVYNRIPVVFFSSVLFFIGIIDSCRYKKIIINLVVGIFVGIISVIITFMFSDFVPEMDFIIHCLLFVIVLCLSAVFLFSVDDKLPS